MKLLTNLISKRTLLLVLGILVCLSSFGQVTKTAKSGQGIKNWGTSGTWECSPKPCNGIPAAGEHVVIPVGSTVNLNVSTTPNLLSVIVQSGGTLIVQGSNAIILSGNFTNNGTFIAGLGTVTFSGTSGNTQTISGATATVFNNITVNNGGAAIDVQVTSPQELTGVLTLNGTSRFDVTGSNNFTLLSLNDDPVADASIAALPSGASVTGNITVQRYISQENRVYRYISTPVSNTSVSDWQDDFAITGNFGGASTSDPETGETTICGLAIKPSTPSMYTYNESVAGVQDYGWVAYAGGSIQTGRGYAPFIRESCYREVIIDVTGTVNQGNISLPVSYTNSGTPDGDGWNLVGNPYPSAIRWDTDGNGWSIGADVSSSVLVRDNISGNFIPVIAGGEIAQGQAFWVKANGSASSVTIQESAKVIASSSTAFYRMSSVSGIDHIKLSLTKGSVTDIAYLRKVEDASATYEKHDLIKLENDSFDLSLVADGKRLSVNSVDVFECGDKIQLHIKDVTNGTYAFNADKEGIFKGFDVLLKDNFTNTTVMLSSGNGYAFEVTNESASKANDRFELELAMTQGPLVTNGVICNATPALLSATSAYEGVTYKWYETMEATTAIHQGKTYQVGEPKTMYVSAINAGGCESPRVSVSTSTLEFPNAAITVQAKNLLSSNYTNGNQWYLNDQLLESKTNQTIEIQESGVYRVEINYSGCLTSASKEYTMLYVEESNPIIAFPNPTQSTPLNIQILAERVGNAQLVNSTGRVMFDLPMTQAAPGVWTSTPDLSALPNGVYIVRVVKDNTPTSIKVIKRD
jgi:trimeric autotransporter adhesin